MRIINNWVPETKSLLKRLIKAGFTLVKGDNGEYEFPFNGKLGKFINDLNACDESSLWVSKDGKQYWIYLVYGNSPGELVSDYHCNDDLDKVTEAHSAYWSTRTQPKKRVE